MPKIKENNALPDKLLLASMFNPATIARLIGQRLGHARNPKTFLISARHRFFDFAMDGSHGS
jgi:hypothetical protein